MKPANTDDTQEIVARYLNGELDPEDEERFEEELLTNTAYQDALEAEQRIATAMRSLEATGDLPVSHSTTSPPTPVAAQAVRPAKQRRWQPLAWAASIVLALSPALFLSLENARLGEQLQDRADVEALQSELDALRSTVRDATRPQVDLPLLRLNPVRSEGETPYRLTLGEKPQWIVLVLEPPEPLGERYALELSSPSGERRSLEAVIDAYGALTLSLYSAQLEDGVYSIEASSASGAPFRTAVEFRRP